MNYNNNNYSKTTFQADIKRKQAMFSRFRRRYNMTTDVQERRWLKTEATRVAGELQVWSKRWQNWNYGPFNWITRNFTVSYFTGVNTTNTRRTTTRKTVTPRTYGRKTTYSNCSTSYRPRTTRTNRTRTQANRSTYVAW